MTNAIRLMLLLAVLSLCACSVHRAASQPSKKDLRVLKVGTERDLVIAEFGTPISTEMTDQGRKEIYTFIQGYSKGAKAGRAFFHGAADVFTLGLWEVVGTPVEGSFNGKKMTIRVFYDDADRISTAEIISVGNPN